MKKISCAILILFLHFGVNAQSSTLIIKQGSIFNYTFLLHGQTIGFDVQVKQANDTLKLGWMIRNLAGGTYIITPDALNKGNKMNFDQPVAFKAFILPPDQTFCMISKKAFQDLLKTHQYFYDNTVYNLKDDVAQNPFTIGGQPLNVLHVVAANETTQIWILNNANFPFVCQITGSPLGIDVKLNAIK